MILKQTSNRVNRNPAQPPKRKHHPQPNRGNPIRPELLKAAPTVAAVLQPSETSNRTTKERRTLAACLFILASRSSQQVRRANELNRTELLILCKAYLYEVQGRQPTQTDLIQAERLRHRDAIKAVSKMTLLGYLQRMYSPTRKHPQRHTYSLTNEGSNIVKQLCDGMGLKS